MKIWKIDNLLQKKGWMKDVYVQTSTKGKIIAISQQFNHMDQKLERIEGYCIPAFPNAHSHSFQYAMAGISEYLAAGSKQDDFWSWREAMYSIALKIDPDQFEAIASMLYAEMLASGYSHVAEFHYLHHDQGGKEYRDIAELSKRLLSAAQKAGIHISLVPIFYQKGGFGKDIQDAQRRFYSANTDKYQELISACQQAIKAMDQAKISANIALGIHSLRAVDQASLRDCIQNNLNLEKHIHIAEQVQEIEDCIAFYGKRPVEFFFDQQEIDDSFHLVHATHLNDQELSAIANAQANVVLCPSTEGNLGDGIFPLQKFQSKNGKWSIGSDSNLVLNPFEEIRLMDYVNRMQERKRNIFCIEEGQHSSSVAMEQVIFNGRKAMGISSDDFFQAGQSFDAVIINEDNPLLSATSDTHKLSTIIYTMGRANIKSIIIAANEVVKDRLHINYESIRTNFDQTMKELAIR